MQMNIAHRNQAFCFLHTDCFEFPLFIHISSVNMLQSQNLWSLDLDSHVSVEVVLAGLHGRISWSGKKVFFLSWEVHLVIDII